MPLGFHTVAPLTERYKGELWVPLTDMNGRPTHSQGRKVFVRQTQSDKFGLIAAGVSRNFNYAYLFQQLTSLRNVGVLNSLAANVGFEKRKLPLEGGELHYDIHCGKVYITDFTFDTNYRCANGTLPAALYRVRRHNTDWRIEGNYTERDELQDAKPGKFVATKHVAVNGSYTEVSKAANEMPKFIEHAYGADALRDVYGLFLNPDDASGHTGWRALNDGTGLRGGTQAARKLSALLMQTAERKKAICWTLHGSGHVLFYRAMRLIPKHKQLDFSGQTVFYANPTMNLEKIDQFRKKLGLRIADKPLLLNDMSLRQTVITGNFISESVVSWNQVSELGASAQHKRTKVDVLGRAGARVAYTVGMTQLPTGLIGAPGWAVPVIATALTNADKQLNREIIESPIDIARHYWGR